MTSENSDRGIVSISKETLATLPAATYSGEIRVIDRVDLVDDAIRNLRKAEIIGFDTETRPSFKRGQSYKVALIQLATPECCYLFRTNIIGLPAALTHLLEDSSLLKVGLSIHDDFHSLEKFRRIEPKSFIDLQTYVKKFRIADNSLSRVYGILFGERISKSQRLTNWEASPLTESQLNYAALDAYSCIRIFQYLEQGRFNPDKSPYLIFPDENDKNQEEKSTTEDIEASEKCPSQAEQQNNT